MKKITIVGHHLRKILQTKIEEIEIEVEIEAYVIEGTDEGLGLLVGHQEEEDQILLVGHHLLDGDLAHLGGGHLLLGGDLIRLSDRLRQEKDLQIGEENVLPLLVHKKEVGVSCS